MIPNKTHKKRSKYQNSPSTLGCTQRKYILIKAKAPTHRRQLRGLSPCLFNCCVCFTVQYTAAAITITITTIEKIRTDAGSFLVTQQKY